MLTYRQDGEKVSADMKTYVSITDISPDIMRRIDDSILHKKFDTIDDAVRAYTDIISDIDIDTDELDTSFEFTVYNDDTDEIVDIQDVQIGRTGGTE